MKTRHTDRRGAVRKGAALAVVAGAILFACFAALWPANATAPIAEATPMPASQGHDHNHPVAPGGFDYAESESAFLAAYTVLMHPRCLNCHPAGDTPFQGEDSRLHEPLVFRGPDGKGVSAMRCNSCHQTENTPGLNMPPGNPNWHLPHPDAPLVFEGLSPAGLARNLKDPAVNGGKSLEQLIHHVTEDSLVLGGWNPGEGRELPPLSHEEFVRMVRTWVEKGAVIPGERTAAANTEEAQ